MENMAKISGPQVSHFEENFKIVLLIFNNEYYVPFGSGTYHATFSTLAEQQQIARQIPNVCNILTAT